jgi:two-component system phosphate regulon response regulator PhoB
MNILILDDDAQRRTVHAFGLCCAGFQATEAAGLHASQGEMARQRPDLVLLFADRLDAQIQSLTRMLIDAQQPRRPLVVAVLAESPTESARVREIGLHDCLAGPVTAQSLIDSVRTWLNVHESTRVLPCGLEVDLDNGVLSRSGILVTLGPTERRLLVALFEYPERVLSRMHLMQRVHGEQAEDPGRLIDISVCRLRRSLKQLDRADLLQTIRGRGYRITLRDTRKPPAARRGREVARGS